jgi:hypothetical protein
LALAAVCLAVPTTWLIPLLELAPCFDALALRRAWLVRPAGLGLLRLFAVLLAPLARDLLLRLLADAVGFDCDADLDRDDALAERLEALFALGEEPFDEPLLRGLREADLLFAILIPLSVGDVPPGAGLPVLAGANPEPPWRVCPWRLPGTAHVGLRWRDERSEVRDGTRADEATGELQELE